MRKLLLIFALAGTVLPHAWGAPDSAACGGLEFKTVAPARASVPLRTDCPSPLDKSACRLHSAFEKLPRSSGADGKPVYLFQTVPLSEESFRFLVPLLSSPAIRAVNRSRIRARTIVGAAACEPNFIYLEDRQLFGMGPAYVSSTRFRVDGAATTNLIVADDGKIPGIPLGALTKEGLLRAKYYDIAIAHEIAHGIMQDLYGLEGFERLEGAVTSREGHFASATTDPRLAWIEGFAEGYEAYLGERFLSPSDLKTPTLDNAFGPMAFAGGFGFVDRMILGIGTTVENLAHLSGLVSDFLKAERQESIRENLYVRRGRFVNLSKRYSLTLGTDDAERQDVAGEREEDPNTLWSKEGVVAHVVYRILAEGLEEPFFRAVHEHRPANLHELLKVFLPSIPLSQHPALAEALSELAKTPAPHELRLEFRNQALSHKLLQGQLDRIDLASARKGRIREFVDQMSWGWVAAEKDPAGLAARRGLQDRLASQLEAVQPTLTLRRWGVADVSKWLRMKASVSRNQFEAAAYEMAAKNIETASRCFAERCLSGGTGR